MKMNHEQISYDELARTMTFNFLLCFLFNEIRVKIINYQSELKFGMSIVYRHSEYNK